MPKYIIIDSETTGLIPYDCSGDAKQKNKLLSPKQFKKYPRILELAWIIIDEDGDEIVQQSHVIKSLPETKEYDIPRDATAIHGITKEYTEEVGISLIEVLSKLQFDLQSYGKSIKYIVGHNVQYDLCMIMSEAYRTGNKKLRKLLKKPMYCMMRGLTDILKLPSPYNNKKYKFPSLVEAYEYVFNKSPKQNHRALGDAKLCKDCFVKLVLNKK